MMDYSLPISDQAIGQLLNGTPSDVDAAVTLLWTHLAPRLAAYAVSILSTELSADCQDVVSDVFVKLVMNPSAIKGNPQAYLFAAVRNRALSQLRKQEVRERPINDPHVESAIQPNPISPPDEIVMAKEREEAQTLQVEQRLTALSNAALEMGPKQRAVAEFMLQVMRDVGRWPSANRIYEALKENEPSLREETAKDRRKEVVVKFNPILDSYGRNPINE